MRKLSLLCCIVFSLFGCGKKVHVKPPETIKAPGYTIIKLDENHFFIAARKEVSKEALDKACNKVQYVCFPDTVGFLYEVERRRK